MNIDQPSQKTLDEVLSVVEKLGPQALASQFQEVALIWREQQCLEQEKAGFDLHRRESEADIQQQSSDLADAWLRLENERRNLQFAANNSAHQPSPLDPSFAENPSPPVNPSHPVTFQQTESSTRVVYPARPTINPKPESGTGNSSGPSLVEQFQLLAAGKNNRS